MKSGKQKAWTASWTILVCYALAYIFNAIPYDGEASPQPDAGRKSQTYEAQSPGEAHRGNQTKTRPKIARQLSEYANSNLPTEFAEEFDLRAHENVTTALIHKPDTHLVKHDEDSDLYEVHLTSQERAMIEELQRETQDSNAENIERIMKKMDLERSSPSWTASTEKEVQSWKAKTQSAMRIEQVDCRETRCRISLSYMSQSDLDDLTELFTTQETEWSFAENDEGSKVDIFIASGI